MRAYSKFAIPYGVYRIYKAGRGVMQGRYVALAIVVALLAMPAAAAEKLKS